MASNFYRNQAEKYQTMMFGDFKSPFFQYTPFKMPDAPSKIEIEYDPDKYASS